MKSILYFCSKTLTGVCVLSFFLFTNALPAFSYPVSFQDADNRSVIIQKKPERVVSLVPAVTELIFAIGAGDTVQGVTYHDSYPPEAVNKPCIGGFFSPSIDLIREYQFSIDLIQYLLSVFPGSAFAKNRSA